MQVLHKAVARGYRNLAELRTNPIFTPLRKRADFRELVAELEAGSW
jgi:hypothetical protein